MVKQYTAYVAGHGTVPIDLGTVQISHIWITYEPSNVLTLSPSYSGGSLAKVSLSDLPAKELRSDSSNLKTYFLTLTVYIIPHPLPVN